MGDEEPLDSHTIELADTRPVMWSIPFLGFLGEIPREIAIILLGLFGLSYNFFGIKYSLWIFLAWFLISKTTEDNPHGLTKLQKYLETCMLLCLDRKAQGGISATPFPQIKSKNRGMAR